MAKLPKELKMTDHAKMRLLERKVDKSVYNMKNLMRSTVKWYGKDDLIKDEALYRHCCYTTRKSNQMGYITDGDIEVIYNKETKTAITVLAVKDKFKPITQYIKPEILKQIEIKKENRKMKKGITEIGDCPDCGRKEVDLQASGVYEGLCRVCRQRKQNAKARNKEYIPYLQLSENERKRIDVMQKHKIKRKKK